MIGKSGLFFAVLLLFSVSRASGWSGTLESHRPLRYAHVTGQADWYTSGAMLCLAAEPVHVSGKKPLELYIR